MGASASKRTHVQDPQTQERINNERSYSNHEEEEEDDVDGSFVFVDIERSCSISSAEDAVLWINEEANETSTSPENLGGTEISNQECDQQSVCEDQTGGYSSKMQINCQQGLNQVESISPKESEHIDIPNNCSVSEEFSINLKSDSEIHEDDSSSDRWSLPSEVSIIGNEEWVWIKCRSSDNFPDGAIKLFDIYEIFSNYGSVSALARTNDHIYIKFSSWAGVANVLNDLKNLKELHQFTVSVGYDVQNNLDKTEIIHLDLPSFVVNYLKDRIELSRAIVIITMIANDNICLNARKIQQVLDYLQTSVSKGFQNCTFFPFGCHVLGCWDNSESLEIFVDVGDMYAGCHKQSNDEQLALSKEVRKLISQNVTWSSHEESPFGVFYHNTVGIRCILYFNNGFGDRITRLLRVFMDYDERFRVLYLVLDTWSRQCSLQGISYGFNSYIVAVLLVFYLQVLPAPLLPPLKRIRGDRPVLIKGWDCSFMEDASKLPRNDCTMDIHSLLRGFFVFYGCYDWNRVVCPVLGQTIDKNVFSSPSPSEFLDDPVSANYFQAISGNVPNTPQFDITTSMCVQDFFNLSENVAKNVSANTLLRFRSLCWQSRKMVYTAECKRPLGIHKFRHLPKSPLIPVPYRCQGSNLRISGKIPTHFNPSHEFGSVSDYRVTSHSRKKTVRFDLPNENEHEVYGKGKISSPRSNAGGPPINFHYCRKKPRYVHNNCNYEDGEINQLNRACNSWGRRSNEANSSSRPYRGRVFWYNRARTRNKYSEVNV